MKHISLLFFFLIYFFAAFAQKQVQQFNEKQVIETSMGKQVKKKIANAPSNQNKPLVTEFQWYYNQQQACIINTDEAVTAIEVFDLNGKIMSRQKQLNSNCLYLPDLNPGIYIIHWQDMQGWQTEKFLLK